MGSRVQTGGFQNVFFYNCFLHEHNKRQTDSLSWRGSQAGRIPQLLCRPSPAPSLLGMQVECGRDGAGGHFGVRSSLVQEELGKSLRMRGSNTMSSHFDASAWRQSRRTCASRGLWERD